MPSLSREQLRHAFRRWWSLRDLLAADELARNVGDYLQAWVDTDAEVDGLLAWFGQQFPDDPPQDLPDDVIGRYPGELSR